MVQLPIVDYGNVPGNKVIVTFSLQDIYKKVPCR
jgi:hypothetical protein